MITKQRVAALVAEFLGTAILVLAVLSISTSNIGIGYFVSFAAGITLFLMVLAIGGISGAHINPAVTIAMWTVRQIRTYRAILYIAVQLLGGYAAYALFSYMTGKDWNNQGEYDTKLLVAEVVGTAIFTMGIAAAVFQKLKGFTQAVVIGGSLTLGIMVASAASSAFLNPAVALGAQSWVWGTYVLGPVLGGIIGVNVYNLLFTASYKASIAAAAERPAKLEKTTSAKKTTKPAKKSTAKKKK
jgi:glycerol uptake facilitator-like aquaporin